jgi:hypothetical protein
MPLVYALHVALEDISPPIWRRLLVPADITLNRLHTVIQRAMGWQNQHLYEFHVEGLRKRHLKLATSRQLWQVAEAGSLFSYVYDFGDGWCHRIVVEEVLSSDDGESARVVCLGGERACPPEDCGGVGGYEDLLKKLGDPTNEEYFDAVAWVGAEFDPEKFDLRVVNAALGRVHRGARSKM